MPRKIAIVSIVAITLVMTAWLLNLGARGFLPQSAEADPAPTPVVLDTASGGSGQPDGISYDELSGEGDDDRYEHEGHGDDGGEHESQEDQFEYED